LKPDLQRALGNKTKLVAELQEYEDLAMNLTMLKEVQWRYVHFRSHSITTAAHRHVLRMA